MRVIAGAAKGARIRTLRGPRTRPTADRVRQTIFDILGSCDGARALDLFAGTGALGIEALSRGAAEAVFVESDPRACSLIEANLAATRMAPRGVVVRSDVQRWLAGARATPFDLVFLDPPYDRGLPFVARILGELAAAGWVRRGGTVVAEAEAGPVAFPPELRETRMRRFGRTQITVAVREDRGSEPASRPAPSGPRAAPPGRDS